MSLIDNFPITLQVTNVSAQVDTREIVFRAIKPSLIIGNGSVSTANVYIYSYPELAELSLPISGDNKSVKWVCASPELDLLAIGYVDEVVFKNLSDYTKVYTNITNQLGGVNIDNYMYFSSSDKLEKVIVEGTGLWSQLTSGASIRTGQTSVVYNNSIFIYGGYNGSTNFSDLWKYDILTDLWSPLGNGPSTLFFHSSVIHNSSIYIFGGFSSGPINVLRRYDIITNTWSQLASGASARYSHSSVIHNDSMYVFGGFTTTVVNDLWRYNILTNTWSQLAIGPSARRGHSAIIHNGSMYVYGGYSSTNYLNDLWRYDILTNTWSQLASGPTARTDHSAVVHNGSMYIFGGHNGEHFNDLWRYDILTNNWSQLESGATARRDHSAIVNNDFMYIFSGQGASVNYNDLWKYSFSTINELISKPHLSTTNSRLSTSANGDLLVSTRDDVVEVLNTSDLSTASSYPNAGVIKADISEDGEVGLASGYQISAYSGDIEKPYGIVGKFLPLPVLQHSRVGHRTIYYNDRIFLFGGRIGVGGFTCTAYNLLTNNWEAKADMPQRIWYHSGCLGEDGIYYIVGSGEVGDNFYSYNLNTNTWTVRTNYPEKVSNCSSFYFNGRLYVFGGRSAITPYPKLNSFRYFDLTGNSWVNVIDSNRPGINDRVHCSGVINNYVYFFGIFNEVKSVFKLSLFNFSWENITPVSYSQVPPENVAAATAGKYILFHGGTASLNYNNYIYNTEENVFTKIGEGDINNLQDSSDPRAAYSEKYNKFYISGGWLGGDKNTFTSLEFKELDKKLALSHSNNQVEIYDRTDDSLLTTKSVVGNITDLKFDDLGETLIATTDNSGKPIVIWNTADWTEKATYGDVPENVLTAAQGVEILPKRSSNVDINSITQLSLI